MYNKLLLYTAVLRPILTYGSPVWGYAADSNIKTLEVAQNSIIRNIDAIFDESGRSIRGSGNRLVIVFINGEIFWKPLDISKETDFFKDIFKFSPNAERIDLNLFLRVNSGTFKTDAAGSDVVQSGRPIFDDFFQHLWPYIGNNTANVVFQMVKRLWLIRIDQ
ncbi:hypothetical protein TNCV_579001 [Trichonephila clavipes]|nr:hypothetical protein TNCV_579001 [Trichonephila clavipes]